MTALQPRSYLFVPGDRPERFAKALDSGADAVVLDLEDAVAAPSKPAARAAVSAWLQGCDSATRARTAVRINDAATAWFADDLRLVAPDAPAWLMLPKAETAAALAEAAATGCGVLALVESARGVLAAAELAAVPGVQRLVFGTLDLALDLGVAPEPEALAHAASVLALASRAAGLPQPVAGVTPEIGDEARLLADWAWARRLGFGAKLCIHPRQVQPLHAAMRPGDEELAWAHRVLAAAAQAQGGAVQVDGRMVDRPVLLQAQALLARAGLPAHCA